LESDSPTEKKKGEGREKDGGDLQANLGLKEEGKKKKKKRGARCRIVRIVRTWRMGEKKERKRQFSSLRSAQ